MSASPFNISIQDGANIINRCTLLQTNNPFSSIPQRSKRKDTQGIKNQAK